MILKLLGTVNQQNTSYTDKTRSKGYLISENDCKYSIMFSYFGIKMITKVYCIFAGKEPEI